MKIDSSVITLVSPGYFHNGNSCETITLIKQPNDDVDLVDDYGDVITSVQTTYGLVSAIQAIENDEFA